MITGAFLLLSLFSLLTHANDTGGSDQPTRAPETTDVNAPRTWNKLLRDGDVFYVGQKQFEFDAESLLKQMAVGPTQLLVDGLTVSLEGCASLHRQRVLAGWQSLEDGFHRIDEWSCAGDQGKFSFEVHSRIVAEGLLSFELSAAEIPRAFKGRNLSYRIAFSKTVARFMHRPDAVGKRNTDLEAGGGKDLSLDYSPFIWLGNDSVGAFWIAESPNNLVSGVDGKPLRILNNELSRVLEIRLQLNPPKDRDAGWHHSFSLALTPIKPLAKAWRDFRMNPLPKRNFMIMWPEEAQFSAPSFGYPGSTNPTALSEYLGNLARGGVTGAPYLCATWLSSESLEWAAHRSLWEGQGPTEQHRFRGENATFHSICPREPIWRDFVANAFPAFIARHKLKAVYLDNAQVYALRGCGQSNGTSNEVSYPSLPQRDGYQRIFESLERNSREPRMVVHSSGGLNLFTFPWASYVVNGEQYRGVVKDDYLKVASLLDFRIELNAARWGIPVIFLPEFSESVAATPEATRRMMALLIQFDVPIWPAWANQNELDRAARQLDRFGFRTATFVPFYSENADATASNQATIVGAYRRPDRLLLLISNLGSSPSDTSICLSKRLLNEKSDWEVKDLSSGEGRNLSNGCFRANVQAGDYAMVTVE